MAGGRPRRRRRLPGTRRGGVGASRGGSEQALGSTAPRPRSVCSSWDADCRGLLAADPELDAHFADALDTSPQITGPFERARTELSYGSRLAGAGRAVEAIDLLSACLKTFEHLGAEPWAARARGGIRAAGGAPPPPYVNRLERLAPLELEIALAAGAGAPLDDIAHRLFLGPRTTRLLHASALAKLGLDSTAQLVTALGLEGPPDVPLAGHAQA